MPKKERLDVLLFSRGLAASREKAKAMIMEGIVYVDGQKEDKAGNLFPIEASLEVRGQTLRLHVLANSDSDADQALKLQVRDALIAHCAELFGQADSLQDAETQAAEALGISLRTLYRKMDPAHFSDK